MAIENFGTGFANSVSSGIAMAGALRDKEKYEWEKTERERKQREQEALDAKLAKIEDDLANGAGDFAPLSKDARGIQVAQAPTDTATDAPRGLVGPAPGVEVRPFNPPPVPEGTPLPGVEVQPFNPEPLPQGVPLPEVPPTAAGIQGPVGTQAGPAVSEAPELRGVQPPGIEQPGTPVTITENNGQIRASADEPIGVSAANAAPAEAAAAPAGEDDPFAARGVGKYRSQRQADDKYYNLIGKAYREYYRRTGQFENYLKVDETIQTMREKNYEPKRLAAYSATLLGSPKALEMSSEAIRSTGLDINIDSTGATYDPKTQTFRNVRVFMYGEERVQDITMQELGALLKQTTPLKVVEYRQGEEERNVELRTKKAAAEKAENANRWEVEDRPADVLKRNLENKNLQSIIDSRAEQLKIDREKVQVARDSNQQNAEVLQQQRWVNTRGNAFGEFDRSYGYSDKPIEGETPKARDARARNSVSGAYAELGKDIWTANADHTNYREGISPNEVRQVISNLEAGRTDPKVRAENEKRMRPGNNGFEIYTLDGGREVLVPVQSFQSFARRLSVYMESASMTSDQRKQLERLGVKPTSGMSMLAAEQAIAKAKQGKK